MRSPGRRAQLNERTAMGSGGKKRTTMAKLNRESKLRERRIEKDARKAARKQAGADHRYRDEAVIEPAPPTAGH